MTAKFNPGMPAVLLLAVAAWLLVVAAWLGSVCSGYQKLMCRWSGRLEMCIGQSLQDLSH